MLRNSLLENINLFRILGGSRTRIHVKLRFSFLLDAIKNTYDYLSSVDLESLEPLALVCFLSIRPRPFWWKLNRAECFNERLNNKCN